MPRRVKPNSLSSPSQAERRLAQTRLAIERERLRAMKLRSAAPTDHANASGHIPLEVRLKGYHPSSAELAQVEERLKERIRRLTLNNDSYLRTMLTHRRENGRDDRELLREELSLYEGDA